MREHQILFGNTKLCAVMSRRNAKKLPNSLKGINEVILNLNLNSKNAKSFRNTLHKK